MTPTEDDSWDAGDMGCGELVLDLRFRLLAMPGRVLKLVATDAGARDEALAWGFLNRLAEPDALDAAALAWAAELVAGPTFANGITKTMLHQEWDMGIDQAIEAEAQAQALCMLTQDFRRAHDAFVARQRPVFQGN